MKRGFSLKAKELNSLVSASVRASIYPLTGVLIALAVAGIGIAIAGAPVVQSYWVLLVSAFGSISGLGATLARTATLLLAALGVSVAFRANVISIGAEGQLYMGALGATFVGLFLGDLPAIVGIPVAVGAGFALGGLWGFIAALISVRFRANEIIITLMMNYIAIQFAVYLISGPWRDPSYTEPFTALLTPGVRLPIVISGTRLHAGIILALLATAVVWWLVRRTVLGYHLTVLGSNPDAAKYAGMKRGRLTLTAMLISGGLAGLAGVSEVAGVQHRMIEGLSPGFGYTAIAISLLARHNPLGIVIVSLAFGGLDIGAQGIQQVVGVPYAVAEILQGLVLLFVIAGLMLRTRQRALAKKKEVGT